MSDSTQENTQTIEPAEESSFDGSTSFSQVNDRLKEIVAAVEDDTMPLDDALALFEEAVGLGMQASSLLEQDMASREGIDEGEDDTTTDDTAESVASAEVQDSDGSTDVPTDSSDAEQQQADSQA